MTLNDVRKKYLKFFAERGHVVIPSASLVPENDQTTLFTGSGMQPLLPYLLGRPHPAGQRLANSQKCFRSEDIEAVGDNRHTTFFEMLGNWSLGDPSTGVQAGYWKEEQLKWFLAFLTEEVGISKERLAVTCFEGDEKLGLPRDTESAQVWQKLGIPKERIFFYGAGKNWWSRSGVPENMPVGEPGGPDSEVFYEFTRVEHDIKFGEHCHPNCDCGRFMEIGNSVFMEYRKIENGFEKLSQRNVDFGGGLERITAAANNEPDVFKVDIFQKIISNLPSAWRDTRLQRIVADHSRAIVFLISDGVYPSNKGAGYILRRLMRRVFAQIQVHQATSFSGLDTLPQGVQADLQAIFTAVVHAYENFYPRLDVSTVNTVSRDEWEKFREVFRKGRKEIQKMEIIEAREAFYLSESFGLSYEIIKDIAGEKALNLKKEKFDEEFKKHQQISRAGLEQKFKGGLADTSEMSVKYHTATHLLHQALRDALGTEVRQKGSNITPERLRFDFTFPRKMTDEEKKKVEDIVNEKIRESLPMQNVILPLAEAEKTGALHFFGEKYGDQVSVYYIGRDLKIAYSKEFCGGPHVKNTGLLGVFKITKEEAVSAGVRRIKAVLA
ncbi:MAG: alanine--tRNA ligase [Candidatus Taylorbacteria bacterium]|nr:alanine--tRNA ligase [Candidatus Taylorbacteria bacterium]